MTSIILTDTGLAEIPELEHTTITELFVDYNSISMIWVASLPPNLQRFDCAFNCVSSDGLPVQWPRTIKDINLDYNNICDTDHVIEWPENLESLQISNNPLQKIPRKLPKSLRKIRMRNTDIQIVEHLPQDLRDLDCYNAKIFEIYALPLSLVNCHLAKNYLSCVVPMWPMGLKVLDLAFNFLTEFPQGLPDTLEHLNLSNNLIKEVPKRIPLRLNTLILRGNKIRKVRLELVARQKLLIFSLADNCLTELPKCLYEGEQISQYDVSRNFLEPEYDIYARKIQEWFVLVRGRNILRSWRRICILREELLQVAMRPDRYGNF